MKLGKTILLYIPSIVLPGLLKWLSVPVFTRVLPIDQYAVLAVALATAGMLSSMNSWIGMALLRFYPEYHSKDQGSALIRRLVLVSFFAALCIIGFATFTYLLLGEYNQFGVAVGLAIISVFLATEVTTVLQYALRIQGRVATFGMSALWKALALIACGYIAILLFTQSANTLLWGYALGLVAGIPFILIVATRNQDSTPLEVKMKPLLSRVAWYGIPLMGAELAVWGLRFSDRWILSAFSSDLNLAQYDATYSVIEASIMVLVAVFQMSIRPYEIVKWRTQSESEVVDSITEMLRLYIVIIIPIAAVFSGIGTALVRVILPEAYWPGATIIPWVAFAVVFLGLQQRLQSVLVYRETTGKVGLAAGIALAINLLMNLITVPTYGFIAAGINTALGYSVFCFFVYLSANKSGLLNFPSQTFVVILIGSFAIYGFLSIIDNFLNSYHFSHLFVLMIAGSAGALLAALLLFTTGYYKVAIKLVSNK